METTIEKIQQLLINCFTPKGDILFAGAETSKGLTSIGVSEDEKGILDFVDEADQLYDDTYRFKLKSGNWITFLSEFKRAIINNEAGVDKEAGHKFAEFFMSRANWYQTKDQEQVLDIKDAGECPTTGPSIAQVLPSTPLAETPVAEAPLAAQPEPIEPLHAVISAPSDTEVPLPEAQAETLVTNPPDIVAWIIANLSIKDKKEYGHVSLGDDLHKVVVKDQHGETTDAMTFEPDRLRVHTSTSLDPDMERMVKIDGVIAAAQRYNGNFIIENSTPETERYVAELAHEIRERNGFVDINNQVIPQILINGKTIEDILRPELRSSAPRVVPEPALA